MPCIVCRGEDFEPRLVLSGYRIATCGRCGLTQLHPPPAAEVLESLYADGYFHGEGGSGYQDYAGQRQEYRATFREEVARLAACVAPGARVLDVGCGYGYFLDQAAAAGYDAYGLDASGAAVEKAREVAPGRVFEGTLESCPELGDRVFDAVFASHVLEHVLEPVGFLRAIRERLVPGGCLVVLTPNVRSLLARLSGRRWVSFKLPEHVAYYDPASIRYLCEVTGFDVLRVEPSCQHYRIEFVAGKLRALFDPLSRIVPRLERRWPLRGRTVRINNGSLRLIARRRPSA